jgi:hypothetical protein
MSLHYNLFGCGFRRTGEKSLVNFATSHVITALPVTAQFDKGLARCSPRNRQSTIDNRQSAMIWFGDRPSTVDHRLLVEVM